MHIYMCIYVHTHTYINIYQEIYIYIYIGIQTETLRRKHPRLPFSKELFANWPTHSSLSIVYLEILTSI